MYDFFSFFFQSNCVKKDGLASVSDMVEIYPFILFSIHPFLHSSFYFLLLIQCWKVFSRHQYTLTFSSTPRGGPEVYPNEICNPPSDFWVYPQASSQLGVSGNPPKEGAQEALLSDFWTTSAGCPWHDGAEPLLPGPSGLMSSSQYLQGCTQQPDGGNSFWHFVTTQSTWP